GDLIVIELMQLKRLPQMGAHRGERGLEIGGQRLAQLGLRERELVRGGANALVRGDQRLLGPARQVGVLRRERLFSTSASTPETGHEPILRSSAMRALCIDCVS